MSASPTRPIAEGRRGLVRLGLWLLAIEAATFLLFALLLVFTNHGDWDHFLAFAEADRRSWVLDHRPPLWSYQVCAGVTRLGDPQSFGFSPFFLPILAFGSFWGLKFLALASMLVGYRALRNIFPRLLQRRERPGDRLWIRACSLSFLFGNFFVWHLLIGHVTVALIPWAMVWGGLALAALHGPARSGAAAPRLAALCWPAMTALVATFLAGGFYFAAVFFAFPLALACLPALAGQVRYRPRALAGIALTSLLGLALAWPRVQGTLHYQAEYPRSHAEKPLEPSLLAATPLLQLAPTFGRNLLGIWPAPGPYDIWEYSAFSANAWALLALAALALARRRRREGLSRASRPRPPLIAFLLILSLLAALLSLGDASPLSLHRLLNLPLAGAIRAIGRYQLLFSVAIAAEICLTLRASRPLRSFALRRLALPWAALTLVNLFTFLPEMNLGATQAILQATSGRTELARMNRVAIVAKRTREGSFMFPAIAAGLGVANCYEPLTRGMVLSQEFRARPEAIDPLTGQLRAGFTYPIVAPEFGNPPESCRAGSYFTQNRIVLDPSCPINTCVNVNDVNPLDSQLRFDQATKKYCLWRRP